MTTTSPFFAALIAGALADAGQRFLELSRGRVSLLGALTLVTLAVVVWAVFFRNRRRHAHRHPRHHDSDAGGTEGETGATGAHHRRRWRRRRREHRPRNPTLAETGGLPPLRIDRPPDPAP